MGDSLALAALVRNRAELAGEIEALDTKLRGMWESLAHVDATILLFDPVFQAAGSLPQPNRKGLCLFQQGELVRLVFDILRQATGPLTVRQIADIVMQRRNIAVDGRTRYVVEKRVHRTVVRRSDVVERVTLGYGAAGWRVRSEQRAAIKDTY